MTFTPPSGSGLSPIVVKGFWDGGNTFVARFTPTVTGTWTYSTADSTITGLTNTTEASGSQIVVGTRTPATTALCHRPDVYEQFRLRRWHALLHVGTDLLFPHVRRDAE